MKIRIALLFLILSSLACMEQIAPTPTPTAAPSATSSPPPATPTATVAPLIPAGVTRATVLAAMVNVREAPDGEVVGQIYAGQSVVVSGCDENWCSISEPVAGYVWIGCLSVDSEKKCEAK